MLDANIKNQLQAYFEKLTQQIDIVANLDDSAAAREMLELLEDIAGLSSRISLEQRRDANDADVLRLDARLRSSESLTRARVHSSRFQASI